ncbi:MAG: insulinase family protein, partial [Chitinophagaceae bacterium]
KNIDATLALLQERLLHPKFEQDAFDRLKKQQIEAIESQETQPTALANNAYRKVLYGDKHVFGTPALGTTETVEKLTLADVQNFYNNYFSPSVANVVVVGDLAKEKAITKLSFLNKWAKKEVKVPQFSKTPVIDKTRIYVVDKENAPQSEIRIGYMAMPYDATGEYFKTGLMNHSVGGDFNSRINLNLREDKGWTYGARTGFNGTRLAGPFTASAGVRANVTDSAVYEFIREMKGVYEKGLKEEEVAFMRSAIGQADARKYETPLQKAAFLGQIIEYDLPKNFTDQRNEIIRSISRDELNTLAKKHLDTNKMAIVVVGDKKSIMPGLTKLGYEVIELDKNGNRLSN